MTPRQLSLLAVQHRIANDPNPKPKVEKGSVGWLMAVAGQLDRRRMTDGVPT